MKIVCFGDSLTSCGGPGGRFSDILQERFPEHEFVNRGVGGETFAEARARLDTDVLRERPDLVLVEFGANDWWRDERPPADWARDLEEILCAIRDTGAEAMVLGVFGPYEDEAGRPRPKDEKTDGRALEFQRLEQAAAIRHGCAYIPNMQARIIGRRRCWADGNHPNEYGNRHVADLLEPVLEELLGVQAQPVRKPRLRTTRDFWLEAVSLAPEQPAMIDKEKRLTFGQADTVIRRLAAGLHLASPCPRPQVAIFLPNCMEYFLLYWAVQRLGGVVVPLNTWLKEESLRAIFANVQPDILVLGSPRDAVALAAAAAAPALRIFSLEAGGGLPGYEELLAGGEEPPAPELRDTDLSIIMHTSGTTSAPKGAMMRHSDLMFNVAASINAHGFVAGDVHLLVNPMFHCTALYSSLPAAACQKSPVVIASGTSPDYLLELVARERVTTFLSVPSVFERLLTLKNLERYDTSCLRLMAYAGSPMPVRTIRALHERFPEVELRNFFGLTETICPTHVLKGEDLEERPDSIGRLLPFVHALVVDEAGREVEPEQVGELLFARDVVISGYCNQPERLQEALREHDGGEWFATGDLASVDPEGYFYIKGRKKDMIIVGGENVFAGEVEAIIARHAKVKEVAVKGMPARGARRFLGEEIVAFVVPADPGLTEPELRKYCYGELPSYKVPQRVRFLQELPRNPAGKVVKARLE